MKLVMLFLSVVVPMFIISIYVYAIKKVLSGFGSFEIAVDWFVLLFSVVLGSFLMLKMAAKNKFKWTIAIVYFGVMGFVLYLYMIYFTYIINSF